MHQLAAKEIFLESGHHPISTQETKTFWKITSQMTTSFTVFKNEEKLTDTINIYH